VYGKFLYLRPILAPWKYMDRMVLESTVNSDTLLKNQKLRQSHWWAYNTPTFFLILFYLNPSQCNIKKLQFGKKDQI